MPSGSIGGGIGGGSFGGGLPGAAPKVTDFAKANQAKPGDAEGKRGLYEDARLKQAAGELSKAAGDGKGADKVRLAEQLEAYQRAATQKGAYDEAKDKLGGRQWREAQSGKLGVDLSLASNNLRTQERLAQTANCQCNGRSCIELGGVWIDENYDAKMVTCVVKAQSDAYFAILEKQPKMKDVFRLGNYLVWVTPNNTALVIDANDGKEKLSDEEIDKLFVAAKK
jgi:Ca-activated chloride channel family protein